MGIIKDFDMFGQQFHFLINNRHSYQTIFGGLISLLIFFILCFITYFFGKPIWYHKSPTVTTSVMLQKDSWIFNLFDGSFFFAFTLTDYFGNQYDIYKDKVFFQITYLAWDNNIDSSDPNSYYIESVPLTKCSELSLFENRNSTHIYDDYFCLNVTNRPIIPYWNNTCKMFYIDIYNCPLNISSILHILGKKLT